MYYADTVGAQAILERMESLAQTNEHLAPADSLRKLASDGGRFIDL